MAPVAALRLPWSTSKGLPGGGLAVILPGRLLCQSATRLPPPWLGAGGVWTQLLPVAGPPSPRHVPHLCHQPIPTWGFTSPVICGLALSLFLLGESWGSKSWRTLDLKGQWRSTFFLLIRNNDHYSQIIFLQHFTRSLSLSVSLLIQVTLFLYLSLFLSPSL